MAQLDPLLFIEQPFDRALEAVDLAIAKGEKARTVEVQPLTNVVCIALVAGEPASGVDQHLVDIALLDRNRLLSRQFAQIENLFVQFIQLI